MEGSLSVCVFAPCDSVSVLSTLNPCLPALVFCGLSLRYRREIPVGLERWNSLPVSSGTKSSYKSDCVYLLPRAKDHYPSSLQGPPRDSCQEIAGEARRSGQWNWDRGAHTGLLGTGEPARPGA